MTEIRPFRGWHYTGDVSDLIAPPYDILKAADKQALLDASGDNIVSVDLPHVPPVGEGPKAVYTAAASKLASLQQSGRLVQDCPAALYAYSQSYAWAGQTYTRRAMMCGVRVTELYKGVWPHEKTFAGPKADRLRLTEMTRMQISPIFGFLDDHQGVSERLWAAVGDGDPVAFGRMGDVDERIWPITDAAVIETICRAMSDTPIFIADGHHRYTTALDYSKTLRQAGQIDEDHEANFVLFTLVATDDPGLLVLPCHRMVAGITDGYNCRRLMAETTEGVQWQSVPLCDALFDTPDEFLAQFGPRAIALLDTARDAAHVAKVAGPAVMADLVPDKPEPWRELDVAILHELFVDRHIAPHLPEDTHLVYTPRGREVLAGLESGTCQMAAILRGTPVTAVREVAMCGSVMPHKSTYFYPKLATGMVLKPLQ